MAGKPHVRQHIKERFYSKVLVRPSDPDGCWEWSGSLRGASGRKYGAIRLAHTGPKVSAHRLSWQLFKAEQLPTYIDHICRNTKCVNPEHLRSATPSQNMENHGVRKDSKSGFRGVKMPVGRKKRFQAYASKHGVFHHFGYFDTAEEAAEAARQGRLKLFTHNELDREAV